MDEDYLRNRIHQIMLGKIAMGGCGDGMYGYGGARKKKFNRKDIAKQKHFALGLNRLEGTKGLTRRDECNVYRMKVKHRCTTKNKWIKFLKKFRREYPGATMKEASAAYVLFKEGK